MSQRTAHFMLAFGVIAFLALPSSSNAGAKIKEHECVGKDTAYLQTDGRAPEGEDAHCTPIRSEILPPGGDFYDGGDKDETVMEEFSTTGALEVLPLGSNIWQTVPTIVETGFRQAGFPATALYTMYMKSSTVVSPLEVTCTVCAKRPQNLGPGQTFVPNREFDEAAVGTSAFADQINIVQEPWKLEAFLDCSEANPHGGGTACDRQLMPITTPGLLQIPDPNVTFLGCKPTTVVFKNPENIWQGDHVDVQISIPAGARLSGTFDVSSCELSYLRGCLPGEGQFKEVICRGEP